ncbi:MAG TPA: hypothetical protein VL691_01130 [Vicinamibacteria bacterium]|nr:hypothetical protein [Vicinamibacteria bacterium]
MTIALGLLAKDGLVIAADRQETRSYMKADQGKVSAVFATHQTPSETKSRCCLIAGAGSAHQIVADQYLGRFSKLPVPDVSAAVVLAAYVMCHTKDSVEGCGKGTDLFGFSHDRVFRLDRDITSRARLRNRQGDQVAH